MSSEALRKIVAPVLRQAGVGEELCHPHVLRHTFATLYMQRDGARLEQLQVLMGHASIDTTAQYLHTTVDELEADAAARDTRRTDAGDAAGHAAKALAMMRSEASCAPEAGTSRSSRDAARA